MGEIWPNRNAPQIGKRITSRLRLRLIARTITTSETIAVEMCDLSYFGARLNCQSPPQPGLEVVVEWGSFEAFGLVVWANPGSFGVRFFDPIGPEVLIATRDLDDADHIQSKSDLNRRAAQAFVQGLVRR